MATKQFTLRGAGNTINTYINIEIMKAMHRCSIVKATEFLSKSHKGYEGKTSQVLREQYYLGKKMLESINLQSEYFISPLTDKEIQELSQFSLHDIKKAAS